MTDRGPRARAGFALIEVLVSIVVVALALTALSAMVLLARELDRRGRSLSAYVEDLDTTSAFMDALIRRAVAGGGTLPGTWTMDERRMAFLAAPPAGTGQFGLARFELAVRSDEQGRASLIVTWQNPDDPEPVVEPVIFAAAAINFAYRGVDPSTGGGAWREHWSDATAFPRAIRLTINREESDVPVELVFRTDAGAGDACPVDPSLDVCWSDDE
jgi:prepilin-type N-terminal cleavage/methylation domain-containing protein